MKKVIQGTGAGDPRHLIDQQRANEQVPENPGWQSEAAYRHHEDSVAEERELSSGQSIPTPLEENQEPSMHHETLGFREPTDHSRS